jgi:SAM-dependent methyltransferase
MWTLKLARGAQSQHVVGLEIVAERARIARSHGVQAVVGDLDSVFPFANESFDLVHANQVIEHLSNVDSYLSEIVRVLRRGGAAVISTENGSSWHNIFAATMGWQIFSLTNVSDRKRGIGNPLALHRGGSVDHVSWTHKTIFNYRGLLEILALHGMRVVRIMGAGYHPLPAGIGRFDVRHSHFITAKAVKVLSNRTGPADGQG